MRVAELEEPGDVPIPIANYEVVPRTALTGNGQNPSCVTDHFPILIYCQSIDIRA